MAAEEMTTISKEGELDDTADVVVQISSDDTDTGRVNVQYFAVKVGCLSRSSTLFIIFTVRIRRT